MRTSFAFSLLLATAAFGSIDAETVRGSQRELRKPAWVQGGNGKNNGYGKGNGTGSGNSNGGSNGNPSGDGSDDSDEAGCGRLCCPAPAFASTKDACTEKALQNGKRSVYFKGRATPVCRGPDVMCDKDDQWIDTTDQSVKHPYECAFGDTGSLNGCTD